MLRNLIALFKLLSFLLLLGSYYLVASLFLPLLYWRPNAARKIITPLIAWFARFFAIALAVKVVKPTLEISRAGGGKGQKNFLLISNHLSYLDIIAILPIFPCSFITSIEIKNTPVLGQITLLAGCLFVERRNRFNIGKEIAAISNALKDGLNVAVFPEATSTNGERVIRFKRPLFQAAIDAQVPLQMIAVNYTHINGQKVTVGNRDLVCWYGDMKFFPHLWQVVRQQEIRVELTWAGYQDILPESTPESLATTAYQSISHKYRPIVSSLAAGEVS